MSKQCSLSVSGTVTLVLIDAKLKKDRQLQGPNWLMAYDLFLISYLPGTKNDTIWYCSHEPKRLFTQREYKRQDKTLPTVVKTTCARALSFPATSSTALFPSGTVKWSESMYFTALRDSTIHPDKGPWASSMWGGIRTPHDALGNTYGPSSKFPFFNKLAAPTMYIPNS